MMAGVIFISAWLGLPWFGLPWNGLGSSPRLEIRLYWGLLKKVNDDNRPTKQTCEVRAISASAWLDLAAAAVRLS